MMLVSTGRTVLCQTLIVILVIAIMRQLALPNAWISVWRKTTRFSAMLISYQYRDFIFETTGIDCEIAPIYVSKKSVK